MCEMGVIGERGYSSLKKNMTCNEPIENLHKQAVAEPLDKYVHADPVQSFPLIASDRSAASD